MAHKIYDIAVKTGSYTDREGQEKGRWENIGAVMKGDDGGSFMMLKRTFNPAGVPDLQGRGGDSILCSLFEPKPHGQQAPQQSAPQAAGGGFDDDAVPF